VADQPDSILDDDNAPPAPEPPARPTAEAAPDPDAGRDLATALEPGDPAELGQYELLGRLGTGGMGTVYLARGSDRRRVAVKVIRPELAKDEAFIRRFHREVAAAQKVAGFCTARVVGADLDPPQPYLVTEYVEGVRLDRAVERNGPLTGSNLDGFAVGVAAALTAIHAANVVHRDLKPSNVVLSLFGPRVIDFGIARALDASAEVTRASLVMGTPGWMAPEQLTGEKPSQASDIFVWGTLVAFAATGRAPFGEGSPTEIALRIVNEPPDLAGFDGPLRATVATCMDKDAARRPSAKALLMELLGEQLDEPVPSGQAGRAATQVLERTWVGAEALGAPVAVRPDQTTEERGRRYPAERPAARNGNGRPAPGSIQAVPPLVPVAAPQHWPDPWAQQRQVHGQPQQVQARPQAPAWPGYPVQQAQPPVWGRPLAPPPPQQLAPPPVARPPYQQQGQAHPLLPGQWQPAPEAGGRRARRGLANALAWIACLGALVAVVALGASRGTEWRLFSVRMLLAYGLLTLCFWLLPAARSSRFRAVLSRLTGLLSALLAVGAFAALAQHRNIHEFGNATFAAFLLTLLAYWMYPKRSARA
jgi:hypothetical protein